MILSAETIAEFKEAFLECYDYEYDDKETAEKAEKLVELYYEVIRVSHWGGV